MIDINILNNKIKVLFKKINFLKTILHYKEKKNRLKEIESLLKQPNIWNDFKLIKSLKKEFCAYESAIKKIDNITQILSDTNDFMKLAIETNDYDLLIEIKKELKSTDDTIKCLEYIHMFSGIHDIANCYIDLQAGSGGTEAQDWTSMLMRMYIKWAESKQFKTEIIALSDGDIAGIKSVTIKIIGEYAYGWLRTENGVHRLVRKSPFDSGNRRHTSFSSSFIYPDIQDDINIIINQSDLRIDVYRASGAGGQHVNKTESAVRITHIPSGLVTQCQSDRSQHKNKEYALKQLKSKLYNLELRKKNVDKQLLENSKTDICWGYQIRSYILDNSKIKDLRTGMENTDIQAVLDGDLDKFIQASLKAGL
uniref:Peptide chain release factor 2 n=1 Tax=Candidatus Aschnera chinzeii TaxID=1485666 RepID=A0AAT9G4H6_9ENTR|nr:MAG: peptide chain release factor 2 [Candidatus Aschnera chinzeii]